MDPAARDAFADLPLEEKALVNDACQRFERALRDGAQPRIEEHVASQRGAVREVLLRELLILACEFELRRQGTVNLDALTRRLPEARPMAGAALEQARRYAGLADGPGAGGGGPAAFPEFLGRFRLKSALGSGAFGTVFLAEDPQGGCDVALKVPHLTTLFSPELRRRFLREGEAASGLDHPNLVKVREVGEAGLVCYIASEYVEGATLEEWLGERRARGEAVSPSLAARLTLLLAEAIAHAHERGVLHCDLKPANVLLQGEKKSFSQSRKGAKAEGAEGEEEGEPRSDPSLRLCVFARNSSSLTPKITDFGLARLVGDQSDLSQTGQILGTPSYMAPEQATGKRSQVTARTDVYALGAILYELLVGRPPFEGGSLVDVLSRVVSEEPARPRSLAPGTPADLEAVCLQCLEKDPQGRYPSAAALAADLRRWLGGEPVQARRVGRLGRAWRWCRRKPVVAGLLALLALAVVGGSSASLALWYLASRSEAEALRNLANEEAARQEAEEHYATLRRLLTNNLRVHTSGFSWTDDRDSLPDSRLDDARDCLCRVIQRRPRDAELRGLLADVLTRQGVRQGPGQSLASFEEAARLWEQIPPAELRAERFLASRATTYGYLGMAYYRRRRFAASVRAYEVATRLWEELAAARLDPLYQHGLLDAAGALGGSMIENGSPDQEVLRRCEHLKRRPELVGGEQGYQVLLVMLRVQRLHHAATRHYQAKREADGMAALREAAAILDRHFFQAPLGRNHRLYLTPPFMNVCASLRRGGAPREALLLAGRVTRSLVEMTPAALENHVLAAQLSISWQQVGKARWVLGQAEGTLDAFRRAVAEQRRACTLAPSVAEYRIELGRRLVQLGRKFCELGRLDEAETCFRERQALWPGDAIRHAEALGELRKWAAQAGAGKAELSPEVRLERQRYLDLCLRLERRGIGPAAAQAAGKAR